MKVDGYEIDVLLRGFPGRMVCHGGLGWSTLITPAMLIFAVVLVGCGSTASFRSPAPDQGASLTATVHRPSGTGPFPAMVLLHTCAGLSRSPQVLQWASWLRQEGFVALVVDSFSARGSTTVCRTLRDPTADEVAWDAYGAMAYLTSLPFVDRERIGVMGWSYGAMASLRVSSRWFRGRVQRELGQAGAFHAAVAFYPHCSYLEWDNTIPILLLLAELDTDTPPQQCVMLARALERQGQTVSWTLYPGAYHGFDNSSLRGVVMNERGHPLAYDPQATRDAEERVRKFLARHLKGAP